MMMGPDPSWHWITRIFTGMTADDATDAFNEWHEKVRDKIVRCSGIYFMHMTHVQKTDHYELHVSAYGNIED